ncbi:MAG TPA: GNAT family N-acetyltransferase [Nocardioides sp.]|uniref:GNAT family N-acetyltransferase n=1 Tax=Nocardioides sp. TaxID=35761 RepID=UPI002E30B579|nr:GNAT family N-acetyltransferase [Nocardioides sp.]HEX3932872.1 GNAT family N-acetyltransferase [Nocardioides sp.]
MSEATLRPATAADVDAVATLFHQGWHDAHPGLVPAGLTERRTPEAFHDRVSTRVAETDDTTVAEVDGTLAGFIMVAGDEAEQVYVDAAFRGSGVAARLLTEAERQVAAAGHDVAWLVVVRGNDRAHAFYVKQGWADEGDVDYPVTALGEQFVSPCRKLTKRVR